MKSLKILLILLIIFLYSCKDEITNPAEEGNSKLAVTVVDSANIPLKNAEVIIASPEMKKTTDAYGLALFENVPEGTREVIGYVKGLGSGKSVVEIGSGVLNEAMVKVIHGRFYEPEIKIISPEWDNKFTPGQDTVRFNIEVRDNETPEESIRVEILNGAEVLAALYPNKNGLVSYGTNSLPEGEHTVVIKAYEDNEVYGIDSVKVKNVLPYGARLNAPVNRGGIINLTWSDISGRGVSKIALIRTHSEPVYTYYDTTLVVTDTLFVETDDLSITSYADTVDGFYTEVSYSLATYNEMGEKKLSNVVAIDHPAGPIYHSITFSATGFDPVNKLLYIADDEGKVIVYNVQDQKEKFVKTFPFPVIEMLIGDNGYGNELYAVDDQGTIRILNPATLEEIMQIPVGRMVNSLEIDGMGHIFATYYESSSYYGIQSRRRSDGEIIEINTSGAFRNNVKIRKAPNSNALIGIISSYRVFYLPITSDGTFGTLSAYSENYSSSFSSNMFMMSPTNDLFVTSSSGNIYGFDEQNLLLIRQLSVNSNNFAGFAFSNDGETLYAGPLGEKVINKYTGSEFTYADRIKTKGYCRNVFNAGDSLILISRVTNYYQSTYDAFGIEVISLF